MTAAASLHAHGMAGTFYIISSWIGQSGFMSMSDLNTLVSTGNEIGGKTVNNPDLPTLSNDEAERQICLGRNVLLSDGFNVTDFAYPFADLNAADETLTKTCGFNSGRGVGNIEDPAGPCHFPDCPYAESIPPADPYQINTPDDVEQTTTLSTLERTVSNAESHGGGWLPFNLHQICAKGTSGCDPVYSFSPTLFSSFLTWLQGQAVNGAQVKTVQQVIGGTVQPAVTPPTVPAAPVGTNALVNPQIQTADPANSANPQCWTPTSFGTNSPSYSWSPTGGATGGGAETITMNNYSSGDAKLVPTFDLGQCAPTATAGGSYALSVYYKSSVPVFLTVYGRSANGTWSYWTQSPAFPASSSWTKATWLTPQVPSTIQALSFGMTISANGTLSTSGYSAINQGSGPPPPPPAGTNLLQNALLQTPDGTGTNPQCWTGAGFGTNSPTLTWSPTGGQTGGQETINMTSWTSGDAKLVTTFDSGNCAPTVTAGHTYKLSLYYESTVPVFITLYSRDTSGNWAYWTQSPNFQPASGWTQATWTTPAVPSNVNGASFGMTIASVGTLNTSNYSMIDAG